MEHKKILSVLASVLAVACVICAVILISVYKKNNYIPDEAVNNIVEILSSSGIEIDGDIIPTRRESGKVYICGSDGYNENVTRLLLGEEIVSTYATPDGEIILTGSGGLLEFGKNFYFRYSSDGEKRTVPDAKDMSAYGKTETAFRENIIKAVTDFLDSGSREFSLSRQIRVETKVERISEIGDTAYVVCTRTIDGIEITDNTVICTYEDGKVTGVEGGWCFLTGGESYSAQLSDILNILFNVKNEIGSANGQKVRIESIEKCYSLYYYGDGAEFCLIPCWQITTDSAGEYIFNALDSTLYTKK